MRRQQTISGDRLVVELENRPTREWFSELEVIAITSMETTNKGRMQSKQETSSVGGNI